MLLAYIDDLVNSGTSFRRLADAYEQIVRAWLERERTYVSNVSEVRRFSEQLAVDLFTRSRERGGEYVPGREIEPLAAEWNVPLRKWQLAGRSLLNRDAEGNYKFAHRSIMEYLFVTTSLAGDARAFSVEWTDQMHAFAAELADDGNLTSNLLTWVPSIPTQHWGRVNQVLIRMVTSLALN
jgi:hypothetical protein